MLNRVKGATPFERRDGFGTPRALVFRRTTSNATFYLGGAQPNRRRRGNLLRASPENARRQKLETRRGKRRFAPGKKFLSIIRQKTDLVNRGRAEITQLF